MPDYTQRTRFRPRLESCEDRAVPAASWTPIADGTLVNWKKKPGEAVKRGENLVDLETDKVVLDIPAPADGVLGQILRQEGDIVTTGEVIATLEEGAAAGAAAP